MHVLFQLSMRAFHLLFVRLLEVNDDSKLAQARYTNLSRLALFYSRRETSSSPNLVMFYSLKGNRQFLKNSGNVCILAL